MNIEEISIVQVQVQAEDVLKDILVTNLPVNEFCQEAAGGSRSPLSRGPRVLKSTPFILEAASYWKRIRISIPFLF
jgi:hypothetical protein